MIEVQVRRPERRFGLAVYLHQQRFDGRREVAQFNESELVDTNETVNPTYYIPDEAAAALVKGLSELLPAPPETPYDATKAHLEREQSSHDRAMKLVERLVGLADLT